MNCNCNCNGGGLEYNGTFVGTVLKYKVEITAEGFSMDEDDFKIVIRRGNQSVTLDKSDLIIHEVEASGSGEETVTEYYMLVDTAALGAGKYEVITYAYVPDDDVEGGIRQEITKQELIPVNAL